MKIAAKDLEIGMMFMFDDRLHRVADIIKDDVLVQIESRRQSVLGEFRFDFFVTAETEFDLPVD
jgi:hypothetical protein